MKITVAGSTIFVAIGFALMGCGSSSEESQTPEEESQKLSAPYTAQATYQGCFTDSWNRSLPVWLGDGQDVQTCVYYARQAGYTYAGLQYYSQCWAGNELRGAQVWDGECNTPCVYSHVPEYVCGGAWRNSVWRVR